MTINVSRASSIDEDAPGATLSLGRTGSVARDAFRVEPEIDPGILGLPEMLMQSHHAFATFETRESTGQFPRDKLRAPIAAEELATPVI